MDYLVTFKASRTGRVISVPCHTREIAAMMMGMFQRLEFIEVKGERLATTDAPGDVLEV